MDEKDSRSRLAEILSNITPLDSARDYWITEPSEVGYDAYQKAGGLYGKLGENTKADAAKHMAWQNELARRTKLPQPIAGLLANGLGVGKEVIVDGLGSIGNYVSSGFDKSQSPLPTMANSLMDIRNNAKGAFSLPLTGNTADNAVRAAGRSTNSALASLLNNLPYARK